MRLAVYASGWSNRGASIHPTLFAEAVTLLLDKPRYVPAVLILSRPSASADGLFASPQATSALAIDTELSARAPHNPGCRGVAGPQEDLAATGQLRLAVIGSGLSSLCQIIFGRRASAAIVRIDYIVHRFQMRKLPMILMLSVLAGCGSVRTDNSPISAYPPTNPERIQVTGSLVADAKVLGRVRGVGCQTGWFPEPGEPIRQRALDNIKTAAARIGATGVSRVSFAGAPIINGCGMRKGLEASGMAFRRDVDL